MTEKLTSTVRALLGVGLGLVLFALQTKADCPVACNQDCIDIPGYMGNLGKCYRYCLQDNCLDGTESCNLCDPAPGNDSLCCQGNNTKKCCNNNIDIYRVLHGTCGSICGAARVVGRQANNFDDITTTNSPAIMYVCRTPVSGACP